MRFEGLCWRRVAQVTWFLLIITHEGKIVRWQTKTDIAILNILMMSAMIIFIDNPGPSDKIPLFKCQFNSGSNNCKKVRMQILSGLQRQNVPFTHL